MPGWGAFSRGMEVMLQIVEWIDHAMHVTLITVGKTPVTALLLAQFILLVAVVILAERFFRRWVSRLLDRTHLEPGVRFGIARMAGYLFILCGLYGVLQVVGFDLGALAVLLGAVGIGIGFGLQNVASNFISGLIILAERPISVGDRVDVDGVQGRIERINLRSTILITNDNIAVIVPNSRFIEQSVVNWSHGDPKVRINVSVGVAYGTDTELVKSTLLAVALANPDALKEPEPQVFFIGFGDSSLDFELGVWTIGMAHRPKTFRSQLNFAIDAAFKKAGVEIPFPQRDLHVRSGRLDVRIERPTE
jgi:small-conductance mechanosensitive channel